MIDILYLQLFYLLELSLWILGSQFSCGLLVRSQNPSSATCKRTVSKFSKKLNQETNSFCASSFHQC